MEDDPSLRILDPLVIDLVAWVARGPRGYVETMEAWRTSCPRLTVWEEATGRGLVERSRGADGEPAVAVTAAGMRLLAAAGRLPEGARGAAAE